MDEAGFATAHLVGNSLGGYLALRLAARHRDGWLKDADWVVLDGVGHCPQLDVPAETVELILEFTGRAR